jgi:hypothetical protein
MSNLKLSTGSLISILVLGLVISLLPIGYAQDGTSIFGYPYDARHGMGSGAKYDSHGSRFTLNSQANITSISCLMNGGYSPTEPNDRYIYRFAIYADNSGKVGSLISQTQTQTFIGQRGGSSDVWNAADFTQKVSLEPGVYWLMVVDNASGYITFGNEYPAPGYEIVTSVIGSMDFSTALNNPIYSPDFVICIYALGDGISSVPEPISTSQKVTRLSVGCITSSFSNEIQITGNLSANRAGVASAPILLSYADNPNATWQEIGMVYTGADGSFVSAWHPTNTGSYVINATYTGNSENTPQTILANVIITSAPTKSQTVFSVDSNSTISNLEFNSQTSQLSFSASGESGTIGYAEIYIAKSLVDDPLKIQATIDGQATTFTVSSIEDAWVLYFDYHHSSHQIAFNLSDQKTTVSPSTSPSATPVIPELTLPVIAVILAAILTITGLIALKRDPLKN